MRDRAAGHVVVVSSGAGLRAFPWGAVYGATKAADRGFAEALRHELSGTGVSVSTVFPGEVATSLHDHQRDKLPDWRRDENTIGAEKVAEAIVDVVERDRREAHVPRAVRALGLNGIAPRLTDRLVAAMRAPPPRRAATDAYFCFFFLTFQSSVAGVGSTLPAASLARTGKVCLPFLTLNVSGEAQGENPRSPSRRHSNVEPGSLALKPNVAVFFLVLSLGRR